VDLRDTSLRDDLLARGNKHRVISREHRSTMRAGS
jgi:hypothetical protein